MTGPIALYVFVADGAGTGVNRFTFGPDPNNPGHSMIATEENILAKPQGSHSSARQVSSFAPNQPRSARTVFFT